MTKSCAGHFITRTCNRICVSAARDAEVPVRWWRGAKQGKVPRAMRLWCIAVPSRFGVKAQEEAKYQKGWFPVRAKIRCLTSKRQHLIFGRLAFVRGLVVGSNPGRRPGALSETEGKREAVTPSVHLGVQASLSVTHLVTEKEPGNTLARRGADTGSKTLPSNLDHSSVDWTRRSTYSTAQPGSSRTTNHAIPFGTELWDCGLPIDTLVFFRGGAIWSEPQPARQLWIIIYPVAPR